MTITLCLKRRMCVCIISLTLSVASCLGLYVLCPFLLSSSSSNIIIDVRTMSLSTDSGGGARLRMHRGGVNEHEEAPSQLVLRITLLGDSQTLRPYRAQLLESFEQPLRREEGEATAEPDRDDDGNKVHDGNGKRRREGKKRRDTSSSATASLIGAMRRKSSGPLAMKTKPLRDDYRDDEVHQNNSGLTKQFLQQTLHDEVNHSPSHMVYLLPRQVDLPPVVWEWRRALFYKDLNPILASLIGRPPQGRGADLHSEHQQGITVSRYLTPASSTTLPSSDLSSRCHFVYFSVSGWDYTRPLLRRDKQQQEVSTMATGEEESEATRSKNAYVREAELRAAEESGNATELDRVKTHALWQMRREMAIGIESLLSIVFHHGDDDGPPHSHPHLSSSSSNDSGHHEGQRSVMLSVDPTMKRRISGDQQEEEEGRLRLLLLLYRGATTVNCSGRMFRKLPRSCRFLFTAAPQIHREVFDLEYRKTKERQRMIRKEKKNHRNLMIDLAYIHAETELRHRFQWVYDIPDGGHQTEPGLRLESNWIRNVATQSCAARKVQL